jgi:membrane-bound lytic murein transglycosylase D
VNIGTQLFKKFVSTEGLILFIQIKTFTHYALAISILLAALCAFASTPAQAVVKRKSYDREDVLFPKPKFVRKQVRFWEKVFYKWPSTTVIVHESGAPDRIIDIIDYKIFAKRDKSRIVPRKQRNEVTKKYLKRYELAMKRFATLKKGAIKYGAIEKRVYQVYYRNPVALKRLFSGRIKVRAQTGLADDFKMAAQRAVVYLPKMREIFRSYGLPEALTLMPFVESMFNVKAYSKVGAAGPWQFMPATARDFMYVNKMVDERKSILKATKSAAQLLAINYRELRSWPHAITAYNHGRSGMKRAIKKLGRRNFDKTVLNYKSRSFGYASRNFYSEFLAVRNVYKRVLKHTKVHPSVHLTKTDTIILDRPTSIAQILKYTSLDLATVKKLNPEILPIAFSSHRYKPLPKYFELTVPRKNFRVVKSALNRIKGKRYARR